MMVVGVLAAPPLSASASSSGAHGRLVRKVALLPRVDVGAGGVGVAVVRGHVLVLEREVGRFLDGAKLAGRGG